MNNPKSGDHMKQVQVSQMVRILSMVLVAGGLIFLGISIFTDVGMKIALPLVFLVFGLVFIFLPGIFISEYAWSPWLYIPAGLLLSLGVIFLLNVITNDWNAWAYAWLLLFPGAGFGVLLANRHLKFPKGVQLGAQVSILLGSALFAFFGVIAGGLFIQIMAPILLVVLGLSLRWSKMEKLITERMIQPPSASNPVITTGVFPGLAETLSQREIEVLHLIDSGLTNAQIAERLTLAQSTIKTHINNIYTKMNVQSRVQAVNRAYELGILTK
jgi:DNA-binding CsgD family transcriptional regulator